MNSHDNRYGRFAELKRLTELVKFEDPNYGIQYHKMIQTGELGLYDYDVGFLNAEIFCCPEGDKKVVRLWMATCDDGDMGGWSKPMEESEAKELAERIANEVFAEMVKFPNLEELNERLRPYGMFVCYE